MKENKLIPKRRFKEFINDDAWEQRKLTDSATLFGGLTYSPNNIVKENGTLVLRSSNVKNGEVVDADNVYVNPEVVNVDNVRIGDIIVVVRNGSRSLIGKHAQIKSSSDNTVIGAFMSGLRSNHPEFINALLDTKLFKAEIDKNLGATINQITNGMFNQMNFLMPSEKEQEEIGFFFKTLDNLITLHQRKLKKLKETKSAYLSELFPKEGEKYPKRRFAGFTGPWEQRKLGEVVDISTGKLDANAMVDNGAYDFYTSGIKKYRIDIPAFEGPAITIAGNGATVGYMHLADGKFNAYQRTYVLEKFRADRQFLYSEISNKLPQKITEEARTGNIPYIVMDMLTELNVCIPVLEEEQIKVGIFIKNLDSLITLHQRKLEKLENLKKAYLNEMFV